MSRLGSQSKEGSLMDGQPSLLDVPNQKTTGDSYMDSFFEMCPS